MSTLAMALAAALVAGSAPEKVSAEVEQSLDLRGEWVGSWRDDKGLALDTRTERGMLVGRAGVVSMFLNMPDIQDEAGGRFRIDRGLTDVFVGIYAQDGERLTLCYRREWLGYPSGLRGGDGHYLLTLHRVKPGK